jgi:integrase
VPHYPKPFFRAPRNTWFVEIDGVQHRLGKHPAHLPPPRKNDRGEWSPPDAVMQAYHGLMAAPPEGVPGSQRRGGPGTPVVAVLDLFLEWCQRNKARRTYEVYQNRLRSFVRHLKSAGALGLTIDELRPFHVYDWADAHPAWAPGMRRGCIMAVQRAFNWAAKQGRIDANPVALMEKPQAGRRDGVVTPEEFEGIVARVPSQPFRDLLTFSWLTGARPQESIVIERRHLDLAAARVVFPPEESKGKKHHRVIYLNDQALALVRRLAARAGGGPIFRNTDGNPWKPFAVDCCFKRLQISIGMQKMRELGVTIDEKDVAALLPALKKTTRVKGKERPKTESELLAEASRKVTFRTAKRHAAKVCMYVIRHSWCTRALASGLDSVTVAVLMGHQDASMVARVYQHLSTNPNFLQEQAKKVPG